MDLLERIQNANKRSEQNNRKSAEAQAQLKLLTTQISELVANYEQKFGISFPNIEDEAKFTKFVNDLLTQTEADLEQKVTVAEKVNQLILDGDILGAQELLGYEPEEESVEDLEDTEGTEGTEVELEDVEEVELEDVAPKRVIEDQPIVKPTSPVRKIVDDLEEEPIAPVKPRRVVDDLEEEEFVAPTKRRTIVEDDEEPVVKPAPRRTMVVDEDEDVAPVKPAQRRTVVDDLDDLEETPVVRPRKRPVVTSDFDMGEDEDAGVSLKELNAVAGVAPRGVSPKAKSPVVMDDLEEEEIVVRPRKRAIIVDEDDSDDVAPARPVRSGGSFKFD
jgi:hypothetical protein